MKRADARPAVSWMIALALLAAFLACVPVAPVVQGTVTGVDEGGKTITVRDESSPSAPPLVIDIGTAEIGARPAGGDQVRVAYRVEGGKNVALRVMNLTQQREHDKKGS